MGRNGPLGRWNPNSEVGFNPEVFAKEEVRMKRRKLAGLFVFPYSPSAPLKQPFSLLFERRQNIHT